MSKSLLTEELTKETYQSYRLCLRVLQSIRRVNTSEEWCRISERERHIGKDIRSHQSMKVSEKFIERHCKAKGRPIGARGAISGVSHVLYAQEVPQRGRGHWKPRETKRNTYRRCISGRIVNKGAILFIRRNKEEHTSGGEANGRAVNRGAISCDIRGISKKSYWSSASEAIAESYQTRKERRSIYRVKVYNHIYRVKVYNIKLNSK